MIPATSVGSIFLISSRLSFVPPNIKEKLEYEFIDAILIFLLNSWIVVVLGLVFGISIYEVTPPAIAAFDSDKIFPLCVSPGSLKCTWSSIIPGIRINPWASITWVSESICIFLDIEAIKSPSISISSYNLFPSLIMVAFFINSLPILLKKRINF